MAKDFDPIEVLAVGPGEGVDDIGSVPKEISFGISYYQLNMDDKRLIIIDLEYDGVEALSDEEDAGAVDVAYELSFSF